MRSPSHDQLLEVPPPVPRAPEFERNRLKAAPALRPQSLPRMNGSHHLLDSGWAFGQFPETVAFPYSDRLSRWFPPPKSPCNCSIGGPLENFNSARAWFLDPP